MGFAFKRTLTLKRLYIMLECYFRYYCCNAVLRMLLFFGILWMCVCKCAVCASFLLDSILSFFLSTTDIILLICSKYRKLKDYVCFCSVCHSILIRTFVVSLNFLDFLFGFLSVCHCSCSPAFIANFVSFCFAWCVCVRALAGGYQFQLSFFDACLVGVCVCECVESNTNKLLE